MSDRPGASGQPGRAVWAETARAKINLALHIVGRRADGYHEIDTLAAFPPFGDTLAVEDVAGAAMRGESGSRDFADIGLVVDGPFAADVPTGGDNLVLAAARHLAAHRTGRGDRSPTGEPTAGGWRGTEAGGLRLRLTKRLPVASGIGGGSADGAAALRLLSRRWGLGLDAAALAEIGRPLGADVPMCVRSVALRARGIGERLTALPPLPAAGLVLANPRVAVSTPAVFKALARRDNPPLPEPPAGWTDAAALADWLAGCRNDLAPAAETIAPAIGPLLADLAALPGALLARLSGSGATGFALFASAEGAAAAATVLAAARPDWWIVATTLGGDETV